MIFLFLIQYYLKNIILKSFKVKTLKIMSQQRYKRSRDETQQKLLLAKRKCMSLKGDDTGILKTLNETNEKLKKLSNETRAAKEALVKFKKQMKQKEAEFKETLLTKHDKYYRLERAFSRMENESYDELRRYRYGQEQAEKQAEQLKTELNTSKEKYNGVIKDLKQKNNKLNKKIKDLNSVIKEYETMIESLE